MGIRGVGMSASGFGGGLEEVTFSSQRDDEVLLFYKGLIYDLLYVIVIYIYTVTHLNLYLFLVLTCFK